MILKKKVETHESLEKNVSLDKGETRVVLDAGLY